MKNVMLLFLSEIHLDENTNLIANDYEYKVTENESVWGALSNEPAIEYVIKIAKQPLEKIYVFATNKIRKPIKADGDKDLHRKTHYQGFVEKITAKFPELENKFKLVKYNEDVSNESFRRTAEMAQKILSECDSENIKLYADMTGGFRHASMLMLSVMRLLKHEGVQIENVLYANYNSNPKRLEDVTDMQKLFDLVAGTESFVRFADITTIYDYYREVEKSLYLTNLLMAMKNFSEAIRICQTSEFIPCLKNLKKTIAEFEENKDTNNIYENFFVQILQIIKNEYSSVLNTFDDNSDYELNLIKWCTEKGFIQQAMTIYTEWIPSYIVREKIFFINESYYDEIKEKCENQKKDYQNWEQFFINEYQHKKMITGRVEDNSFEDFNDNCFEKLKKYLHNMACSDTNIEVSLPEQLKTDEIKNVIEQFKQLPKLQNVKSMAELKKQAPAVWKYIFDVFMSMQNGMAPDISLLTYFKTRVQYEKILIKLSKEPVNRLIDIFNCHNLELVHMKSISTPAEKWVVRKMQLENIYDNHIASSIFDKETAFKIIEDCQWVRNNRNEINHAATNSWRYTSEEIIMRIRKNLNRLFLNTLQSKNAIWQAMPRNDAEEMKVADEYFDTELMPLAQALFIEKYAKTKLPQYYGMVLTLGTSWQPLALSISALKPQHILILLTEETMGQLEKLIGFLGLADTRYQYILVNRSEAKPIFEAVTNIYATWEEKGKCCMDITGGTKAMASSAAMIGAVLDFDIYYVESKYLPVYRRPEAGSERLERLDNPKDFTK